MTTTRVQSRQLAVFVVAGLWSRASAVQTTRSLPTRSILAAPSSTPAPQLEPELRRRQGIFGVLESCANDLESLRAVKANFTSTVQDLQLSITMLQRSSSSAVAAARETESSALSALSAASSSISEALSLASAASRSASAALAEASAARAEASSHATPAHSSDISTSQMAIAVIIMLMGATMLPLFCYWILIRHRRAIHRRECEEDERHASEALDHAVFSFVKKDTVLSPTTPHPTTRVNGIPSIALRGGKAAALPAADNRSVDVAIKESFVPISRWLARDKAKKKSSVVVVMKNEPKRTPPETVQGFRGAPSEYRSSVLSQYYASSVYSAAPYPYSLSEAKKSSLTVWPFPFRR